MEQINLLDSKNIKTVHFIGIGGISMSGLAEILKNIGYTVSGSDMKASNMTEKLERDGIKIHIGHSEENIDNCDLVVYTAAVKENNSELVKARQLGITTIERAVLLGQIMKKYPFSLAISGTHGKTTTTSMVSMIMLESNLDPTIHIGGELDAIGGNTRIGGNKYFITEACEYVESFLKFYPTLAIVLNIEEDHLDYFKDINHIKQAFLKFMNLVPKDGYIIACADDENVSSILSQISTNVVTYGINSTNATWTARNIEFDDSGCASYDLIKSGQKVAAIKLRVPGIHNVSNSIAAAAACYTLGCDIKDIEHGLEAFTGTHRRFEVKGVVENIKVVDDYAHHPSEIKATLKAAKSTNHTKIWCVFQPHTYTRTKLLLDEFSEAFSDADEVIISDIYSAREIDTGEIHSNVLSQRINAKSNNSIYKPDFNAIVEYLKENASSGDLVITMGAGDVYKVGEMFLKEKDIAPIS
ncbi:UDP-N-acetylmuramate--L-alanine ligase [Acetivibrio cellulolyticus]|uniref:UDP-N-acetylmuramate--L-alanine ligase n=1 Tax=Acetivibrio cellulolyticus TaxID=35830 RepID=UPI0001E2CC34|nr:UDP-N-acetylmuramate--L-alanine ligase [Acetivibrio cellulolyticus]